MNLRALLGVSLLSSACSKPFDIYVIHPQYNMPVAVYYDDNNDGQIDREVQSTISHTDTGDIKEVVTLRDTDGDGAPDMKSVQMYQRRFFSWKAMK